MRLSSVVSVFTSAVTLLLGVALFSEDKVVDIKTLRPFAEKTNQFGFDLYHRLRRINGNNIFFSPYSISTALAMAASGAQGETLEQMTKVLKLEGNLPRFTEQHQSLLGHFLSSTRQYELRIANALWGQQSYPFKNDFLQQIQQSFRATGRTLDFVKAPEQSREIINQWVETHTRNYIRNLLPEGSITPMTRLVLTNAIYFKGSWLHAFEKSSTRTLDFTLLTADKIKIEMMQQKRIFQYIETDNAQIIEKPYQGSLSMMVILPKQVNGLANVEEKLSVDWLALLRRPSYDIVDVTLPKFKTTYKSSLKDELITLGMVDAFHDQKANFAGMDGSRQLYLSQVFHQAYCDVNEEGTEATAASSAVGMVKSDSPIKQPKEIIFNADHPFLFLIRDTQTGTILFMGRMMDPRN